MGWQRKNLTQPENQGSPPPRLFLGIIILPMHPQNTAPLFPILTAPDENSQTNRLGDEAKCHPGYRHSLLCYRVNPKRHLAEWNSINSMSSLRKSLQEQKVGAALYVIIVLFHMIQSFVLEVLTILALNAVHFV